MNSDLIKNNNWEIQWKMSFNPNLTKQPQEKVRI